MFSTVLDAIRFFLLSPLVRLCPRWFLPSPGPPGFVRDLQWYVGFMGKDSIACLNSGVRMNQGLPGFLDCL